MTAQPVDYDVIWQSVWGDVQRYGPVHRHERRLSDEMISSIHFESVLEVGCGQGENLGHLLSKQPDLTVAGVDVSAKAIECSRRLWPRGRFEVLDVQQGHLPTMYDLVICSNVIEHLNNDDSALAHIRAMTKRWFLITTLEGRMRKFEPSLGHIRNYQPGELRAKCEAAGFKIVRERHWGFPFYSPLYRNFLDLGTMSRLPSGRFGPARHFAAQILYALFSLNSSRKGDVIMILAEAK